MTNFFSKRLVKLHTSNSKIPEKVRKAFQKKKCAYVVIACEEPDKQGEMEVEMCYEGDTYLVAYMLENAVEVIENKL